VYTIYHIVGKKVGCTVNFEKRKKQYQDGTRFDILEVLEDSVGPQFAGDREWFWADYFGYKKGSHYTNTWNFKLTPEQKTEAGKKGGSIGGKIGGKIGGRKGFTAQWEAGKNPFQTGEAGRASAAGPNHSSKTGKAGFYTMTPEQRSAAGKIGAKRKVELGLTKLSIAAAIASPNHPNRQFLRCLNHNVTGNLPSMKRWHRNCTLEKVDE
jgi:general stress protein YciG